MNILSDIEMNLVGLHVGEGGDESRLLPQVALPRVLDDGVATTCVANLDPDCSDLSKMVAVLDASQDGPGEVRQSFRVAG